LSEYVNFLILGLGNGGVFAALAMALVVTYRSSGVLNFATGAQALYAAYTYSLLRHGQLLQPFPWFRATFSVGGPMAFWPALFVTLAIQAILGVAMYGVVFRPLRNHRPVAKAVASIGIAAVVTALVDHQVGSQQLLANSIYPQHIYALGHIRVPGDRLWLALTIVAVSLILSALYRLTRFGLATRAASESEFGAFVSGLSPDAIAVANWAISAAVAGVAGILIAPLVPLTPSSYTLFIVPALAAAVVGQFFSIGPAVASGLAIGAVESVAVYLNTKYSAFPAGASECIPLLVVLVVLVVRGKALPGRGSIAQLALGRAPRPNLRPLPAAALVSVAVVALFLLPSAYRGGLINSFIMSVIALSLVVVTGYVGQISLAQLTLAGVAGFALSTIAHSWGVPFPIAPILASAFAMTIGVVVGLPALRVRGLLVAIETLTLAAAVDAVWFRNNSINGGADGAPVPTPRLFGLDLGIGTGKQFPRPEFGLVCLLVVVVVAVGVATLRRSRIGSAMLAVKANERSAAAAGINVARIKLIGFGIGAFVAGMGGCLIAYQQSAVTFQPFDPILGLTLFSTVFLAGITSVSGGLLAGLLASGGLLFTLLSHAFNIGDWYGILAGAGVVLTVIFNPEGIVGPFHTRLDARRQRFDEEPTHSVAPSRPEIARQVVAEPERVERGTAATPLLEVEGLTVHYGGVTAVSGLSLSVSAGAIVGLIGPNGAGKTTTMDALGGFTPYEGTVCLAGRKLDAMMPHARAAAGLGRTFQGVDLYEDLTVEENVIVGQHLARSEARSSLADTLGALDLTTFAHRKVSELSQGQRQLVSIGRALAGHPRLLLLDEPAAGLDSTESAWLADRLRDVRAGGTTILLIDHDMSLVLSLCDQIYVIDFGSLIATGGADEVRANRRVAHAYLGATHAKEAML
jgi:ABC-type branched-subunit amino acid transport system ATPase component/branched-subunit amino acid ABC-type transport system permease component